MGWEVVGEMTLLLLTELFQISVQEVYSSRGILQPNSTANETTLCGDFTINGTPDDQLMQISCSVINFNSSESALYVSSVLHFLIAVDVYFTVLTFYRFTMGLIIIQ
jgi:hypothetical protein